MTRLWLFVFLLMILGCSGGGQRIAAVPSTQPVDGIAVAAGNAVVSKLDTALAKIDELRISVNTTATGVSYQSNVGAGAICLLALVICGMLGLLWYDERGDQQRERRQGDTVDNRG